ncbi:MAG: class I SAM-dependent methyltransferase [Bacteroidetes bacterium]|nr:class I SAM-dependent methyltransferase [Bacteroidota bacterium]
MTEKYKLIAHEWDIIAEQRLADLKEGVDLSYKEILRPNMIKVLSTCNLSSVLDIGCGVGVFTEEIGMIAEKILAIDLSCKSIQLAKENSSNPKISYECLNFLDLTADQKFSTIYANMLLMALPELPVVLKKVAASLNDEGNFVFSITHPSFWPIYWNYSANDFNYNAETEIITDFRIRNKTYHNLQTRHYHRPISMYIDSLLSAGFRLKKFIELRDIDNKYWYPRFLLIVCIKTTPL